MSSNSESSSGLSTGLSTVFKNTHLNTSPTDSVATEIDPDETEFNSTENENNNRLYDKIHQLQNENKILKHTLTNMKKTYADVPLPSTVIADRTGNSLYTLCPFYTHPQDTPVYNKEGTKISLTPMQRNFINSLYVLCPFTTKHPKDAPVFDKDGNIIKGEKLFKDSPVLPPQPPQHSPNKSRKRTHKSHSPKTPPQRKTHKTPPSPGNKSKRRKR